ncbi:hypothetical protein EIP91_007389 [Steccherinum ochraceum]|uniref:Uncharacterized protein n=1 Tax=Steccherinum ochraceum TaxID=92696 RepID=A0A4R0RWJ6_9APHY|nr:hypothetical protein EIP91_007389 [Steccherinum ochraceum]
MSTPLLGGNYLPMMRTINHPLENPPGLAEQEYISESRRSSTSTGIESPISPLEFASSPSSSTGQPSPRSDHNSSTAGTSPRAPPPSHSTSPYRGDGNGSPPSSGSLQPNQSNINTERYLELQAGDIVYWHHLVRSGEIPAVIEDARARGPLVSGEMDKFSLGDEEGKVLRPKQVTALSHGVIAGR